jgi:hypothetical protein
VIRLTRKEKKKEKKRKEKNDKKSIAFKWTINGNERLTNR